MIDHHLLLTSCTAPQARKELDLCLYNKLTAALLFFSLQVCTCFAITFSNSGLASVTWQLFSYCRFPYIPSIF